MASLGQETSHWLSVTEETLFLHDGLMRVTDLVELPHDVTGDNRQGEENDVISFDTKDPEELCERLRSVCGNQNNAFARLLEYRLNSLRGLWNAQLQCALESQSEREGVSSGEAVALLRKQGLWREPEQSSFSTRVSLLLVLPLLQSQSKYDPGICGMTAELLVGCLQECAPLSLSKEPNDCLNGLERLLCAWLGEGDGAQKVNDPNQRKTAATALVALACARGHLETFIHTTHLLQHLDDQPSLPIGNVLKKLAQMEGGTGPPSAMLGNKHMICWGFEDILSVTEKEANPAAPGGGAVPPPAQPAQIEPEVGRSLACDGKFLYLNSNAGKGVMKMGTGLHGTLRGYIYLKNPCLSVGWLAWGNDVLLHRPLEYDKDTEGLQYDKDTEGLAIFQILDRHSLRPLCSIYCPDEYLEQSTTVITTISLCSDGIYFYWIWCCGQVTDKPTKGQNVYMDVFEIDASDKSIQPVNERLVLQKKEDSSVKTMNESLLSRLRPYRTSSSSAASLVALTGGNAEPQAQKKEETSSSCGLPLKTLVRSPVFCDGNCVVLVIAVAGSAAATSAAAAVSSGRFSFGAAAAGIAGLRSLASNLCFNVSDGQFNSRSDLVDAPSCVLGRGAPVLGMAACFDPVNNCIWSCGGEWIDQYLNPGHLAPHHIRRRLLIPQEGRELLQAKDVSDVSRASVIHCLLQHVGFTSVHQLNESMCSTTPVSTPVSLPHLAQICDVLQHAVTNGHIHIIICTLVLLQVLFKTSVFKKDEEEEALIKRTRTLIWRVLHDTCGGGGSGGKNNGCTEQEVAVIQREFCGVISAGLTALYPLPQDQFALLHKLLTQDESVQGLNQLRDLLLVEFADQLRNTVIDAQNVKYLRLTDELISLILKIAVKESNQLLRQCQTTDKQRLDQILADVPVSSPCVRYLMALQVHLLREAVLQQTVMEGGGGGGGGGHDDDNNKPPQDAEALQHIQDTILSLAEKVFGGAYEVLETILETCNFMINSSSLPEDLEWWLAGLERVTKATILAQLLPTLLTGMTHYKLHCLGIADTLMPQLVQLVVLTSQAALLLKSQVEAIHQDDLFDLSSDTDIAELIGQSISLDSLDTDEEEQGFLAGLKIPAPWTSGKSVESIHPVRDNYRYKNTVHIPGARCLYLRFDPRCSSQYDYDKLVLYAGPNTSSRKVAEYGGNTFGYGSRSVLGSGWPKDLIKIDGDTVTFSFEMRSGREHNTPDKAMWGFLVTVRARESPDDIHAAGLPFLADLALGLSVLACTMLHMLYQGPEKSKEEELCQHVLQSKLLQRCVWQSEKPESPFKLAASPLGWLRSEGEAFFPTSPSNKSLPRVRLPVEIVRKLRELSGKQPPQIRPSIREVLKPEVLEESILSAAIKHLSLVDTVRHFPSHEEHNTGEYRLLQDVMSEVYRRLYAMIRQLQNIAELEQKWKNEVDDARQDPSKANDAFFIDYHLIENKTKELAILCFLKDVEFDAGDLEQAVSDLSEKLQSHASTSPDNTPPLARTRQVVTGLLERLSLLLQVTIAPESGDPTETGLKRSVSHMPEPNKNVSNVMVRSDTDVLKASSYRSMSLPADTADDSVIDIARLAKKRQRRGPTCILQDLVEYEDTGKPPHVLLLEQLFSFIGSNPEKAVSSESFLSAARVRYKRGNTRKQALIHMKELLTAASRVGGATHLVAAVTSVLQHGPRVTELTCGGMCQQVRDAFAETMTSVVQLAARYPMACCNSIGLLCIVPYTRAEERCLVRSGLVHLLDKLCSLTNQRGGSPNSGAGSGVGDGSGGESQTSKQRVSAMAWAGFQVLSNRCVTWEHDDSGGIMEQLEHSGLARQVSSLLTNHLARATECSGSNAAAGNEALQEVLSLLNNLGRSRMGKAILSQPGCVSKLLSLLLDQRPSPKLVLIILQLCRVALPLMSSGECEHVELPAWGYHTTTAAMDSSGSDMMHDEEEEDDEDEEEQSLKIASLLLAKLGDFLVPGGSTTMWSRRPSRDNGPSSAASGGAAGGSKSDKSELHDGRLAVYVHKRDDQSSHEVIQPLLRLSGGANMEKVVRMDGEMTKTGKAEVTTEEAVSALRKAAKWAQMGLVVSTGAPADTSSSAAAAGGSSASSVADKKKMATETICRDKNGELARMDPVRPFISGHVANSLAAEVIALLHSLLTAPETMAAQLWATAVEKVLSNVLSYLPVLLTSVDDLTRCNKEQVMSMAKLANAGLAALGGFEETIKPGCHVQITGDGIEDSPAIVQSVSEQTGLATVELCPPGSTDHPRYSETVQVPLSRLKPPRNEPLPLHQLSMTESLVWAIQSLLLPQNGLGSPMSQHLPIHDSDGNSQANQICRLIAEIKSRASKVLACHLQEPSFARAFIEHSSASIDILKCLALECNPGERLAVVETQCQARRMLYRDCAKPPPPPTKLMTRQTKEITWDATRSFPPVRAAIFSQGLSGVSFLGDPSVPSGLPRGLLVYASQPLPTQAPSFYWEMEICSFGDTQDESGPFISFGFMPAAERKDGGWTQPVGSCLFHNNGRAVHYNGSSLLLWKSVRLDVTLNSGDTAGIGWQRQPHSMPPMLGQTVKGVVYFTHNGRKLQPTIDDVAGGMWPVVHIQKKNTRIHANFGQHQFAYAAGTQHRSAADECQDIAAENRETFGQLPFNLDSGSDSEGGGGGSSAGVLGSSSSSNAGSEDSGAVLLGGSVLTPPGPPCRTATIPPANKEYNPEECLSYKLLPCYENFPNTGRLEGGRDGVSGGVVGSMGGETDSDLEDVEGGGAAAADDDQQQEDHYILLVKAWEQKVFPTIRRRFRNEAERKDGLEQIRGALQLGMTDIARQTVEFLYEENGGMPRDLHLPTIEDIREELAKFTIDRVRKGTVVVIRPLAPTQHTGMTTTLPKFAVRSMLKTFSLMGTVMDVDQSCELVQVESYLRSEGVLVRFWYPIDMLERPPQGYRKSSIIGNSALDTANIQIHRSLLDCEYTVARMHCRAAFLELINQCNSPAMELASCSTSLGSAMAASTALLQELDVENLQLLSNHLLAPPQPPHGSLSCVSLDTAASSPWDCMAPHTCSLIALLYAPAMQPLVEELKVAIARAANQGEDYLMELSNQICMCLQTAPEMFPYEEIPVTESKICTDIHFPGACFLVVSCRSDPKAMRKDTSLYKSPWARIFTYRGHRIKKNGSCTKQEVLCYPRDCSSNSNKSDQYAPAIIPTDLLHIRVGVSPPPGVIVTIHAFPQTFPLALAYMEILVAQKYNFEYRRPEGEDAGATGNVVVQGACAVGGAGAAIAAMGTCPETSFPSGTTPTSPWRTFDSVVISPPVLLHITELIGGYLWRSSIPSLVKEYIFHLLAQTLRVLSISESGLLNLLPTFSPKLSPTAALLLQLQTEIKKLYEEETKNWQSNTTLTGTGIGLGVGDSGRFSTYFHALMEVCLAIGEVTQPKIEENISPDQPSSASTSTEQETPITPKTSTSSLPVAPSSPMSAAAGKRKKLKAKRERGNSTGSLKPRSSSPKRTLSEGDVDPEPSGSSITIGSKPEEILWFHRALTMSQILRFLMRGNSKGEASTKDAVMDAVQSLTEPTAYCRLLVISGIPTCLDDQAAKSVIRKACNSLGGLYREEVYLPVHELEIMDASPDSDTAGASASTLESSLDRQNQSRKIRQLQGFAVIELRTRAKVDLAKQNLTKDQILLEGLTVADMDVSEETLTISGVNQSLLTEIPQANTGLESYLFDKLVIHKDCLDLSDGLVISLTEIFHSCFISEQRVTVDPRQESGYICLGREQITLHTPGNLMYSFFSAMKAMKKSFHEHVKEVLRRYGVPKVTDKDDSDKKGKMSGKKSSKPSGKEKLAMATRSGSREKKLKPSTEKVAKDAASSESSKAKAKEAAKDDDKLLTLDGFMSYVTDKIRQDVRSVWQGLMACGYDLHFDRSACIDGSQAQQMSCLWSVEMDAALVHYVNTLCLHQAISPARLHPHEIYLTPHQLASAHYSCLQGVPVESLRLRFALLQSLNNSLESFFLPLVDMRPALSQPFSQSMASLLADARSIIFYDNKTAFLNRLLNATAQRKPDQAAPEITLDPLENVAGEKKACIATTFCQALRQLSSIPSSQLCVRLAAGGDPTYAFNVKFTGEEVHGTSGSFRHFLGQVAREIESSNLGLLLPVMSSQKHRGKYLVSPGLLTFAEEKLLQFFGQLLAITMRADIPLGLDLMPVFWKNLSGLDLDPVSDLQEADPVTYGYLKKFELVESEEELQELCVEQAPTFVYNTLTGDEVELFPGGSRVMVNWENRQQYVDCIRNLREREVLCHDRMCAIKAGMASIVPLQSMWLLTPADMQMRLCGLPEVNLHFLRAHTMYQVGLMETDVHIQYFWNVLSGLSQDDLAKFIKFACNQERVPQICPCRDGGADTAHVPPYPMKIAPPDGAGSPDARHIRVETCMFMIKLPQYSSEQLMRERLLYAIHCREDPLSG